MAFTVEMIRGTGEHFDCSYSMWSYMLSLAQSFGWTPIGTLPYSASVVTSDRRAGIKADYDPERCQGKWLSGVDARNLAGALWRAATAIRAGRLNGRRTSTGPGVIRDNASHEAESGNPSLMRDIEAFANYCQRGEFRFAFDN